MFILILFTLLIFLALIAWGAWTLLWARRHWRVHERLNRYWRR